MKPPTERIAIQLHAAHVADIPNELIDKFEAFITERTRKANGRLDWFDQPREETKFISGFAPPEVIDLLCAIRLGHTKKIEAIMTHDYESQQGETI